MNTEQELVRLIADGRTRKQIATELGLGVSTVRRLIRRLCEHYDCTQRELPDVAGKENNGGRGSHRIDRG
jgi:DNA-binding NarL/FixJ family response regulator